MDRTLRALALTNYRRNYLPGGTFCFTLVTYDRRPILTTELGRMCLRRAISESKQQFPFRLFAICLLPDHLQAIWILPQGEADFSARWKRIKQLFSKHWIAAVAPQQTLRRRNKRRADVGFGNHGFGSTPSATNKTWSGVSTTSIGIPENTN